ncbi:MAG: hypothetical protein PHU46_12420 [Rhodocyclaceae bacterium]|nr:hypothetical protein [Rhodocyclaceae bacterium]
MKMARSAGTSAALAAALFGLAPAARADLIKPGFDLFHTTSAVLASPGGPISFDSYALANWSPSLGVLQNTDTIVARKDGVGSFPQSVSVEVEALSLKSHSAVDLGWFGGPSGLFADLYATINNPSGFEKMSAGGNRNGVCDVGETCSALPGVPQPDALPASASTMTIKGGVAGGSFDSTLNVYADLIFTAVGDRSTVYFFMPADHDPGTPGIQPIVLKATGSPWSGTPGASYPLDPVIGDLYLPAGGFYSGPILHEPDITGTVHNVDPSAPEIDPASGTSALTLILGSLGLLSGRRQRRHTP